jgi:hypothetical protein
MSDSKLSFSSSENFRKNLVARNLAPYQVQGVYTPPANDINYETVLSDTGVIDSPDKLISEDPFADSLYPLNQYGPEGGYEKNITYNNPPLPVASNDGPYQPTDTVMDLVNEFFIDTAYVQNQYGPEGGYQNMVIITDIQNNNNVYLPYWEPPIFRPSSYNPYSILVSDNPVGSDGSLSQDSYVVKLGAIRLQDLLKYRAALSDNQDAQLIGDYSAFGSPQAASTFLRGNLIVPENDYRVTLPPQTDTFLTRLQGVYIPSSPIPGDYFLDEQNTRNTGTLGQAVNLVVGRSTTIGDILGPAVSRIINPSIVFLENTGSGQKSALFQNLSYNRFRPQYGSTSLGGIATNVLTTGINAVLNATGTQLPGDFYVGSVISNPENVESPVNEVPIDAFGKETGAIVYGGSELGILYEGNESKINFGLAGRTTSDGGGINGEFVWVSPKYKDNAGFNVGPGGKITTQNPIYPQLSSDYTKNESTNLTFKVGSILDETQRLIDSADRIKGEKRLRHVGNAINQVSKVFHDGYKELTKGSKVMSYQTQNGVEVGIGYCRVFAKDTPYYTFNDLQKTDGNIRQFSYSVLDKTYNLNIAPLRGNNSTNIANNQVKKYMFSIENLAWRSSNRAGYRVSDLPVCERGPNGGRVMWFPPYEIKFNETSTPSFNPTTFLGRPEPVYTYKDTSRSGSISWKMIVDHPSILNVIVDKVLANEKNRVKINSVIDSFFAGCKKYDIYELAAKYNTIPTKDLVAYQDILTNPKLTPEQLSNVNNSINKDNTSIENSQVATNNEPSLADFSSYSNLGFYFNQGAPAGVGKTTTSNYKDLYSNYTDTNTITNAENTLPSQKTQIDTIFNSVIIDNFNIINGKLIDDLKAAIKDNKNKITITLEGSNFKSEDMDSTINDRRTSSIKNYFDSVLGQDKISIKLEGTSNSVTPSGGGSQDCQITYDGNQDPEKFWSVSSIACRSIRIKNINVISNTPNAEPNAPQPPITQPTQPSINQVQQGLKPSSPVNVMDNLKKGLSKQVLRQLLSECDYFDVIEQSNPMIYDSIKEKIKYFNPAFHSMTPEGLNARLTFLQQCVRPGDTIPTLNDDGTPRYDNSVNTAFGTPPVLVLRIGDFYNTKIIPTSLQLSYEPLLLDINPEGVGVQPMLANVTLGFNFIGGSGLKEPIDQLQNALSFNYYANTEMYDERAEATEDTSKLDKQVFQAILDSQPPVTTNNVPNQNQNNGGTYIGSVIVSNPTTTGETGEIKYETIMDNLVEETNKYFENIVSQSKSIVETYNYGILQLTTKEKNYSNGDLVGDTTKIFGKPQNIEEKINELFDGVISDINGGTNPILTTLSQTTYSSNVIRDVKKNMVDYVTNLKSDTSSGLFKLIQNIVDFEQNYVQIIRKLNYVNTKSDGKILTDGSAYVFNLSATTDVNSSSNGAADTYVELVNDAKLVSSGLTQFLLDLQTAGIDTTTYGGNGIFDAIKLTTPEDKRFYMVMSQIFTDSSKLTSFINSIITGDLANVTNPSPLKDKFNSTTYSIASTYQTEFTEEKKKINDFITGPVYPKYKTYTPYSKGKTRKFTYNTQPAATDTQKKELQNLYKPTNVNTDADSFLGKIKFN